MKLGLGLARLAGLVWIVLSGPTARADDVADFYRGRTITLIAGFNVGGGADAYARVIARHLGAHIAGGPAVVVKNMQGAGSMLAANHVFNVSPKDGSEIGLFAGNIVVDPVIGGVPSQYDARRFNWIGAPASESNICVASPDERLQDHRRHVQDRDGHRHRRHLDLRFSGGAEQRARHQAQAGQGLCGQRGVAARHGARRDRRLLRRHLGFDALRRARRRQGQHPVADRAQEKSALAGVPFVMDYAKREEDRQVLRLVFGWLDLERPLAAPPGTPAERVAALRAGFDAAMRDPALLADAAQASLSIDPMDGSAIARFVEEAYRTPPAVAARAARLLGRAAP